MKTKCQNCNRIEEMENELVCKACWNETFPVLSIARGDLLTYFPSDEQRISLLTDEKINLIATRLHEIITESTAFMDNIKLAGEGVIKEASF